jgi:uncharacterized damage-inducible protein DinB
VEDIWINYIIPGRFKDWTNTPFDEFKDFAELKKFMRYVKETTEAYLNRLTPQELDRSIILPWGDPAGTRISIEAALAHKVIEDLIHYGELSDLLFQEDAEPPHLGFWRYIHNITSQDKTSK